MKVIILSIIIALIIIGWAIFMMWYASPECIDKEYRDYVKRKIKNENKNGKSSYENRF